MTDSIEARPKHCRSLSLPVHNGLTVMLMAFLVTGLIFMLLPGTFIGVWNLIRISSQHVPGSADAGWIQAHGQAQIFGWLGSFIFGISLYVVPKMRMSAFSFPLAWLCWGTWTAGTLLRWVSQMYTTGWRIVYPHGAILQFLAFVFFALVIFRPSGLGKKKIEPWFVAITVGTIFLGLTLGYTVVQAISIAMRADAPVIPHVANQQLLVLTVFGFLVPLVWGYSARWLAPFLGLQKIKPAIFYAGLAANVAAVATWLSGATVAASFLVLAAAVAVAASLGLFVPVRQKPRSRGVHDTFPMFVRFAYAWLGVAVALNVWAALTGAPAGIVGASRHAITVGFFSTMVFTIGPRVLPAFAGMRKLFSARLMFASLVTLTIGCTIRVVMQILAYQGYAAFAWQWLPVSALIEMTAMTLFAINMGATLLQRPTAITVAAQLQQEMAE